MLTIKDGKFYFNNEVINIYSGAIHYFRVIPEYWEDRLLKLKLAGLNCVETYVAWNVHEKYENQFDFENGIANISKFLETANKLGLKVILRPGPYICAEWDNGGLPYWILKDRVISLRSNDEKYLSYIERFFSKLFDNIKDHFSSNGGCIIAVQVENEYGSYGNDKKYLNALKEMIQKLNVKELLFTSDGDFCNMLSGGTIKNTLATLNSGSNILKTIESLNQVQKNMPKMVMEFWIGWFDNWYERHHTRDSASVIKEVENMLENDIHFNMYMFHGGTNFGFGAGANRDTIFRPTTTSYDYSAPLTEWGGYTNTYHELRRVLHQKQKISATKLLDEPKSQLIKDVKIIKQASLFENLDKISTTEYSPGLKSMEDVDLPHGMILYSTTIKGDYCLSKCYLEGVHDVAYVYINGEYKYKFDRRSNNIKNKILFSSPQEDTYGFLLPKFSGECRIDILVDSYGHVNFGEYFGDLKGLYRMRLNKQKIFDWQITKIPLDNLDKLEMKDYTPDSKEKLMMFYECEFLAEEGIDTFIDMKGFTKGIVYINGFNLGRYVSTGAHRTLYIPGPLVKKENKVLIFEHEKASCDSIDFVKNHVFKGKYSYYEAK